MGNITLFQIAHLHCQQIGSLVLRNFLFFLLKKFVFMAVSQWFPAVKLSEINEPQVIAKYFFINQLVQFNTSILKRIKSLNNTTKQLLAEATHLVFMKCDCFPEFLFSVVCWMFYTCLSFCSQGEPATPPPSGQTPPWADTSLGRHSPCPVHAGIHTPYPVHAGIHRHTPVQWMLGYGQQAGGTHPTGVHSSW